MARSVYAGATSFVHLLGLQRRPAAAEDDKTDDDDKKKAAEDDDDTKAAEDKDQNAKAAEDDDDDDDDKKKAAEDDDDDKPKSKRAEDDDDGGDAKATAIRLKERARCAAIFAHPAAAKRPDMAAHLAFGTNLSRSMAISTLKAVAAGEAQMMNGVTLRSIEPARTTPADAYRARMASEPSYEVGTDRERPSAEATTPAQFAKLVLAADNRRRGIA